MDILHNYWIVYTVKIKAFITPNIYISEVGAGGARMQLPKRINDELKSKNMLISEVLPNDFIDLGNDAKSALSKAKANAMQNFGICADVTARVILSERQCEQIQGLMAKIVQENIVDPRDKVVAREKWNKADSPHEKLQILIEYAELFETPLDLSFLQNKLNIEENG